MKKTEEEINIAIAQSIVGIGTLVIVGAIMYLILSNL